MKRFISKQLKNIKHQTMRFNRQLLDSEFLEYKFTLSSLWGLRERLVHFKDSLENIKEKALTLFDVNKLVDIEQQLSYVNQNIDRVEYMMITKENDIFIVTGMGEICLN